MKSQDLSGLPTPGTPEFHAAFIKRDDLWPLLPILPIKRYEDGDGNKVFDEHGLPMQCGLIGMTEKRLVVLSNLHEYHARIAAKEDVKCLAYPSIESMVNDGWRVD